MKLESSKVHLDPSSSSKTLDANELNKDNLELIEINYDWIREIKALLREKRILQQETNKLSSKAKELELEVERLKNEKIIEPCLSCEKLTHVVGSLNNDVSKLQDEGLNFSKFKTKAKLETIGQDLSCVYSKPIIPQTHISNSYGIQVPIINNEEMEKFYKPTTHDTLEPHKAHFKNNCHNQTSPKKKDRSQIRNKFYRNKRFQRTNNTKFAYKDNPLNVFSEFGLKILCNLLQDPRMYNMGMVYANLKGPKRKWGPRA